MSVIVKIAVAEIGGELISVDADKGELVIKAKSGSPSLPAFITTHKSDSEELIEGRYLCVSSRGNVKTGVNHNG